MEAGLTDMFPMVKQMMKMRMMLMMREVNDVPRGVAAPAPAPPTLDLIREDMTVDGEEDFDFNGAGIYEDM
jgi:hypothetical protein